jgi:hypothetical protein
VATDATKTGIEGDGVKVKGAIARLAPLVDQLQRFCRGHEAGHGRAAAATMLVYLRGAWVDVPEITLQFSSDRGQEVNPESLVLALVRDVGELAGELLASDDPDQALAWARANLIVDVERYASALGP